MYKPSCNGKNPIACCTSRGSGADVQVHTSFVMVIDGPVAVPVPACDISLEPVHRTFTSVASSFLEDNRCPHPFRITVCHAPEYDSCQIHVLRHRNLDLYTDSCCKHLVPGGFPDVYVRYNSYVQLFCFLCLRFFNTFTGRTLSEGQGVCSRFVNSRSVSHGLGYK